MLDVATIETGERQFRKEKFDLLLVAKRVVEDVQRSASSHELIFDSITSVNVVGDQEHVEQVIINLLYLSAEIIRQTGGAIWVESKINEGSTFSFSLPVVQSQ
jgi:signal transduction histidine kinase